MGGTFAAILALLLLLYVTSPGKFDFTQPEDQLFLLIISVATLVTAAIAWAIIIAIRKKKSNSQNK